MIRALIVAAGMLLASHIAASAQNASAQKMTVQSLLNDGYTIAGVATSPTGGGLVYLQKASALMLCFVTETPNSTAVDTRYCKPVK
jgi:hypothetical protein